MFSMNNMQKKGNTHADTQELIVGFIFKQFDTMLS